MSKPRGLTAAFIAFVLFILVSCGGGTSGESPATIAGPVLASIQISPTQASLSAGQTQQYTALATFSAASTQDVSTSVTWRSSDPGKADIDGNGLVKAIAAGSTTITASLNGVDSNVAQLTVTPAPLVSIQITPVDANLPRGVSQQYTAIGTYADASSRDISANVSFASSDTSKATISAGGLAIALATGTANITATLDGATSNVATLTVTQAALQSIRITPSTASQTVGLTQRYTAVGTYSDASTPDITRSVSWSSSDAGQATIDASGLATGVAAGSVGISASMDGVASGTASLTLTAQPAWTPSGPIGTARARHTATLLSDGKVLVTGGQASAGFTADSQVYDPSTGAWTAASPMSTPRTLHTATLLPNGKVLVVGGNSGAAYLGSCELYDPATGTWAATGALAAVRNAHTATLLADGKVLVTGGNDSAGRLGASELYDPATGTWTATGSLGIARNLHTATLLGDGKVLVTGGVGATLTSLASSEVFDPASGTWTTAASLADARFFHAATLLTDGKVLVTGGNGSAGTLASAEIYDPQVGTWSATGPMGDVRRSHTTTLLANGAVLVAGGNLNVNPGASSELYDPNTGRWIATSPLSIVRNSHTATALPDARVLIVGGFGPSGVLAGSELY